MKIYLHDLVHFTLSNGGDFVTLIPRECLELEEGDDVRVVYGPSTVFEGTISHEWRNTAGIQVIQAVMTSLSSSGYEDYERIQGMRVLASIESMLKQLDSNDRNWVINKLKEMT